MTTPRIEEKIKELRAYSYAVLNGEKDFDAELLVKWIEKALTEAHQAGIDEAVEKIKEEFEKRADLNENPIETPEGTIDGSFYNIYRGHWEKALDDTIKALQDNK